MTSEHSNEIAIIAANYNYGDFLEEFIKSIINSTVQPSQIIIVDDGSTDRSKEILNRYQSLKSSEFIFLPSNTGLANALNIAISHVKCPFVMRADTDDRLHPLKIEKQLDFLLRNPDLSGVGCNVVYFDSISNKKRFSSRFPLTSEKIRKCYLNGEHGIQHPTVMLRTSAIQNYQYHQESFPAEDYHLFATMTADGHKFANLAGELYEMRIHKKSISSGINYKTIEKTYFLRDKIFGTKTSSIKKLFYLIHIVNYRRFLLASNPFTKWFYLAFSLLFAPSKIIKRLK